MNYKVETKYLEEAIEDIRSSSIKKFCFVVGAGISCPEIPLAKDIIDECKKEIAEKYKRIGGKISKNLLEYNFEDPMIEYFKIFEGAYPNRKDRWQYFKNTVSNSNISFSNFFLGQILASKKVSKIVITPNFDDFLSRTLSLLDTPYVLTDHPQTIKTRYYSEIEEIQIIHVHGSHKFFDIKNTEDEINNSANEIASTMTDIFKEYSPIIIGYSGLGSDAIMTGLKNALWKNTSENDFTKWIPQSLLLKIYWFCYKNSVLTDDSKNSLPNWLKKHPDVVFVVPDEIKNYQIVEKDESEKFYLIKTISQGNLEAEVVFTEFIERFKIAMPKLFTDPIRHYEIFLKGTLPKNKKGFYFPSKKLLLSLSATNNYLKELQKLENEGELKGKIGISGEEVKVYEYKIDIYAMEIEKGVQQYLKSVLKQFSEKVKRSQNLDEEFKVFGEFIDWISDSNNPKMHLFAIQARYLKGIEYWNLENEDEAIIAFNQIIDWYSNFEYSEAEEWIAKAMLQKGIILKQSNEMIKSNESFDKLIKKFGNSTSDNIRELVEKAKSEKDAPFPIEVQIKSLINKSLEYLKTKHPSDKTRLEEIIVELDKILKKLNSSINEISILEEIIDKLKRVNFPKIQVLCIKAYLKKAEILKELIEIENDSNHQKMLIVYNEIERKFEFSEDNNIQALVIETLYKKIELLSINSDDETSNTFYKISLLYAKRGEKELCLGALKNALDYNSRLSEEVKDNSLLQDFFKDGDSLDKLLEKYED